MKKKISLIILAAFCLALYACQTTNDCPAYGKANVNVEENV